MIRFYKVVQVFNSVRITFFSSCSHSLTLPAFCALDVICSIRYFAILFLPVLASIYFLPHLQNAPAPCTTALAIRNFPTPYVNGYISQNSHCSRSFSKKCLLTRLRCYIDHVPKIHNSPSTKLLQTSRVVTALPKLLYCERVLV